MHYRALLFILFLSLFLCVNAEEKERLTSADYMKAERFLSWNLTDKIFNGSVSPHWIDDNRFWYRNRFDK